VSHIQIKVNFLALCPIALVTLSIRFQQCHRARPRSRSKFIPRYIMISTHMQDWL